jgi:hypothetical protein
MNKKDKNPQLHLFGDQCKYCFYTSLSIKSQKSLCNYTAKDNNRLILSIMTSVACGRFQHLF